MASCWSLDDPFRCPTKWELFEAISALLPRGRAWQTHEDVLEIGAPGGEVWPPDNPYGAELTVMQQFWAALAEPLEYLHQRACALIPEFFCSTVAETRREWEIEYGFPDPCEPYDRLCDKVNAIGGTRCEYFTALGIARGWAVTCTDCATTAATSDAGDCAAGDCSAASCNCDPNTIIIQVKLASSPAYVAPDFPAGGDCAVADCSSVCDPGVEPLLCLIERVKPAHIKAIYQVI